MWCTFDLWKMVCKWTLIQCSIYKFIVDSERKCITSQGKWERNWHILQWNWHMFLCDCFNWDEIQQSWIQYKFDEFLSLFQTLIETKDLLSVYEGLEMFIQGEMWPFVLTCSHKLYLRSWVCKKKKMEMKLDNFSVESWSW